MNTHQPNMQRVHKNIYVVRTQAGFEQAVKNWIGGSDNKVMTHVVGYPSSYPALLALALQYNGENRITASILHLNELKQIFEADAKVEQPLLAERIQQLETALDNSERELRTAVVKVQRLENTIKKDESYNQYLDVDPYNNLPLPRLQMEARPSPTTGWQDIEWVYSLVYQHYLGGVQLVPMGITNQNRYGPGSAFMPELSPYSMPFRDGKHLGSDFVSLKLPAYLIISGKSMLLPSWDHTKNAWVTSPVN